MARTPAGHGADAGYPIGDQLTYFSLPFLVGSQSHLDQVFEGRIVRRASTPSPLARAAAKPVIRYEHDGQTLTLDDYLARHPLYVIKKHHHRFSSRPLIL